MTIKIFLIESGLLLNTKAFNFGKWFQACMVFSLAYKTHKGYSHRMQCERKSDPRTKISLYHTEKIHSHFRELTYCFVTNWTKLIRSLFLFLFENEFTYLLASVLSFSRIWLSDCHSLLNSMWKPTIFPSFHSFILSFQFIHVFILKIKNSHKITCYSKTKWNFLV